MSKKADQLYLIPPYCPNYKCRFHFGSNEKFFVKNGWTVTEKAPFKNQRYKCKNCYSQFSENTFRLDFRKRIPTISEEILFQSMNGVSNGSISKRLKVSEGTIRNRLRTMAHQSLLFEKANTPKNLTEDVAYDGFETFTHSQYSPCYVNTAVGSRSMFIYHNTFSPLNRKGRMTANQKIKNHSLIKEYGLYPQDSVFQETCYILKNLSQLGAGRTLFIDEHKAYQRAIRSFDFRMKFETINSKVRRDASNPLFPINRLHNLYRHFLSSQKRETIAFQKHEAALLEKIQLMKIYQNFMKPKFVRKNKFDPKSHEWSPAMYVGVAEKILSFEEIFGIRKTLHQEKLDDREISFLKRRYPYSRQTIAA